MKRKADKEEGVKGSPLMGSKASRQHLPDGAQESVHREAERRGGQQPYGALPEGWLECPPFGEPLFSIVPSKVPLGRNFKELVPPGFRYSPETALRQLHGHHVDVGLVIDLTNTSRYYHEREWTNQNVKYIKLPCRGRDEVPDDETVNRFVFEVWRFHMMENLQQQQQQQHHQGHQGGAGGPGAPAVRLPKQVLVHCTHGHNRTGYCIVHYLMRWHGGTVAQRLEEFARARPPGIYKEEYIAALFRFYHEPRPESVVCPGTPEWKRPAGEDDVSLVLDVDLNLSAVGSGDADEDEDGGMSVLPPRQLTPAGTEEGADMTNDDVLGSAVADEHQMELQKIVHTAMQSVQGRQDQQQPLNRHRLQSFPGSQPVSLSLKNLVLLRQRLYHVTWKADGMRYMMLLCTDGAYLIDRNFRFRRLQLRFPYPKNPARVHNGTLLDGEMVIDALPDGTKKRRYLIYDLVMLNTQPTAAWPFGERWVAIDDHVIRPRRQERMQSKQLGRPPYDYDLEEIEVRRKDFYVLGATEKLLRSFIPRLSHESDGLIFQGWSDPYVPGTHEGLLKWKYAHMNSVDFLLQKGGNGRWMLLLSSRPAMRQLEGAKVEFPNMEDEEVERNLVGRVIECCWVPEEATWQFMRPRPDKEHPNAWHTYQKVMDSIRDNITEEKLLEDIGSTRKLPKYAEHEKKFEKEMKEREMKLRQHQQQQQQHHHHHVQQQRHHHQPQQQQQQQVVSSGLH